MGSDDVRAASGARHNAAHRGPVHGNWWSPSPVPTGPNAAEADPNVVEGITNSAEACPNLTEACPRLAESGPVVAWPDSNLVEPRIQSELGRTQPNLVEHSEPWSTPVYVRVKHRPTLAKPSSTLVESEPMLVDPKANKVEPKRDLVEHHQRVGPNQSVLVDTNQDASGTQPGIDRA